MDLRFTGETMEEIVEQVIGFMAALKGVSMRGRAEEPDTLAEVPDEEPVEESVEYTGEPVIEEKQPELKDVREVLKDLRDKKGAEAVKKLLSKFGANSVPELKPEDYKSAIDNAKAEV